MIIFDCFVIIVWLYYTAIFFVHNFSDLGILIYFFSEWLLVGVYDCRYVTSFKTNLQQLSCRHALLLILQIYHKSFFLYLWIYM